MKFDRPKKLISIGFFLILLLSVVNIMQSGAIIASNSYDINPLDYEVNVQVGDVRTYLVDHVHQSFVDEYGIRIESHEMQLLLLFNGTEENVTINEGTIITAEVKEITNESIRVKAEYRTLDGPTYYPDDYFVNRSSLNLLDRNNVPRLIMTTNHTLIDSVFADSEWYYELTEYYMRFDTDMSNGTYNSWREIEYDGYSGFLRHMVLNFNYEDSWFSFSLHEVFISDPNEYTLGVSIGDMMTYTITTISFWDEGMNMYHNDFPITILENGEYYQHTVREGDSFKLLVVETEGTYLRLQVTYYLTEGEFTDERPVILDKSTGYFLPPLDQGYIPPMVITTNDVVLQRLFPMNYEIIDDELTFSNSWEDPGRGWKQSEKAIWNWTTGWMKYYGREEYDNDKLFHKFELVSQNYSTTDETNTTSEFPIGVVAGDSNILEFKTISMKDENGSLTNVLHIEVEENGATRTIGLTVGDRIEIIIKNVMGSNVTVVMKINSSIDGNIESDPWVIDFALKDEDPNQGPPLLVPNDFEAVKNLFGDKANVTQVDNEIHVKITHVEWNDTFIDEFIYDTSTGWLIKMSESVIVDDEPQLIILVESIGQFTGIDMISTDETPSLELTPMPLWPTMLLLVLSALIYRRKRI